MKKLIFLLACLLSFVSVLVMVWACTQNGALAFLYLLVSMALSVIFAIVAGNIAYSIKN